MSVEGKRKVNFLFGVAFALNAALLIQLPKLGKGTGIVERDIMPLAVDALLAVAAIWPSLRLLRVGEAWQRVVGLLFLVLPVWILYVVAWWGIEHW